MKRARRADPHSRNRKDDEATQRHDLIVQPGSQAGIDELNAPGERQHGGSDAEADHVGERIHFTAEIAGGVGHARDAAVQAVEQNSQADGYWRRSRKWRSAPEVPSCASMAPLKDCITERKPRKMLPAVKSVGSA